MPLIRYLHTLRYLKAQQIASLLCRRLLPRPKPLQPVPEPALRPKVAFSAAVPKPELSLRGNQFRFLNITRSFNLDSMEWQPPESKLWRYNLHYFNYLHDIRRSPDTISRLIDSWISSNPPEVADAWEPFPASLRIVNWVKLFLDPEVAPPQHHWLRSLYQQALWLEQNLERHLLANHYFKNGKALFFAGSYFGGADAERWLAKGLRILRSQLAEQVLPDGGHFERSPMYHAMVLEDCLDLYNLCSGSALPGMADFPLHLESVAKKMLYFLLALAHPDGGIPLFNDAALGVEADPAELAEYHRLLSGCATRLPDTPAAAFPETGYYVMSPRSGDHLVVDCGAVGPDYQPGHSHSDTLSFELSLQGKRVIVDSGCSHYLDDEIRRYNRGNAGHNTLTIDAVDQSETWSAHRCARRARPLYARLDFAQGTLQFSGAHDGYLRLKGRPVHHRRIVWSGDICVIEDRVEGRGEHDLESRLHIHPALQVTLGDGSAVVSDGAEILAAISTAGPGRIEVERGWYCPQFGLQLPCTVLVVALCQVSIPFGLEWIIAMGAAAQGAAVGAASGFALRLPAPIEADSVHPP